MLDSLFATTATTTAGAIEIAPFMGSVATALALGLVLSCVYSFRAHHTRNFVVALAVLPAIVAVVIAVVNGNVGAGVAVAGAFSLVRFRSVPGSARDIAFIFLAMCVGLVCGMGYVLYAAIVTLTLGAAFVAYQAVGFGGLAPNTDRTLRVTVPEDLDYTTLFDDILAHHTTYSELVSVKTTNMGSLFKLVYNIGLKDEHRQKAMIDEIRCRNGNLEVALTHQEMMADEL